MGQLVVNPVSKAVYVTEADPDANKDGLDWLGVTYIDADKVSNRVRSYLETDLSSIPRGAVILPTSKLDLFTRTLNIYSNAEICQWCYLSATWVENTIIWNNAPAPSSIFDFTGPTDPGSPGVIQTTITGQDLADFLSNALKGGYPATGVGTASWALKVKTESGSEVQKGFEPYSDDFATAAYRPKLTVDYLVRGPTLMGLSPGVF